MQEEPAASTGAPTKARPEAKQDKRADVEAGAGRIDATRTSVSVADIIGEYGLFQFALTLLTFVRYVCVAMMTNTGPLIAPSLEFWCEPPDSVRPLIELPPSSTSLDEYLKDRCWLQLTNGSTYQCPAWRYNTTHTGRTLTDSFDLVCERNWLRSAFQSSISVGVVLGSVMWGSFSDRHGRNLTVRLCFGCSLASGLLSYSTSSFLVYTLARALCSFSDLGLVASLATTLVEQLGNRYRGTACLVVYTGWACGVMIMPWIVGYFRHYQQLMLFTILCHLFTLPWLLMLGESVRWLLVSGKIEEARRELRRISWWNLRASKTALDRLDSKFNQLKGKFVVRAERARLELKRRGPASRRQALVASTCGGLSKVGQLLQSRELAITTGTLVWTTFNSELFYMLFIMINSDIGDDVKLNYAIGGIMEVLATGISIVVVASVTRKLSLVFILVAIANLCLALAMTHHHPLISVWILNLTKLAISTLSSILFVVTTEIFPTNLRQTGFGVTGTLGSFGAVVAPFIRTELVDMIGMRSVMVIMFFLPLTAALLIPFFLRETKDLELSDDVDELDDEPHFDLDLNQRRLSLPRQPAQ